MLRVRMACGIVARDISVDFTGGDNFKPLFLPCVEFIKMMNRTLNIKLKD